MERLYNYHAPLGCSVCRHGRAVIMTNMIHRIRIYDVGLLYKAVAYQPSRLPCRGLLSGTQMAHTLPSDDALQNGGMLSPVPESESAPRE